MIFIAPPTRPPTVQISAFPYFLCLVCKYEDDAELKTSDVCSHAVRMSLEDVPVQIIMVDRIGGITPLIN